MPISRDTGKGLLWHSIFYTEINYIIKGYNVPWCFAGKKITQKDDRENGMLCFMMNCVQIPYQPTTISQDVEGFYTYYPP